jgi:uncharacterized membrane protein
MAHSNPAGVPSRVAIAGHPLHPMMVTFPIAFLVGALGCDVASVVTADPFWARSATWCLIVGIACGLLAGLGGLIDFVSLKQARIRAGWIHAVGNALALCLSIGNLTLRLADQATIVSSGQLVLSAAVVSLLALAGWMGGELVFRHKIGVIPQDEPNGS